MKNFISCFMATAFFFLFCTFASGEERTPEEKCNDFFFGHPAIGELEEGLAHCKEFVPPELHALMEKAAILYAKEAIREARIDIITGAARKVREKNESE
ncbi:MAG: hypothetical protein WAV16_04215 [Candidatus Moraniibacteriota bacterium]